MTIAETKSGDRFLRRLSEYREPVPIGLTVFDVMKRGPGPSLNRVRIMGTSSERAEQTFRTDPDELLCIGATVGVSARAGGDGLLRHFHPDNQPQKFVGFVIANERPGRCLVWTRGRTVLRVPDIKASDVQKPVYAIGVNTFSLNSALKPARDSEIGRIVHLEGQLGMAVVAFKSADDDRPLDIRISR